MQLYNYVLLFLTNPQYVIIMLQDCNGCVIKQTPLQKAKQTECCGATDFTYRQLFAVESLSLLAYPTTVKLKGQTNTFKNCKIKLQSRTFSNKHCGMFNDTVDLLQQLGQVELFIHFRLDETHSHFPSPSPSQPSASSLWPHRPQLVAYALNSLLLVLK